MTLLRISLLSITLLSLHQPDGKEVLVNLDQVDFVGPADSIAHPKANSRVLVYGVWFYLRETRDEVKAVIDRAQK